MVHERLSWESAAPCRSAGGCGARRTDPGPGGRRDGVVAVKLIRIENGTVAISVSTCAACWAYYRSTTANRRRAARTGPRREAADVVGRYRPLLAAQLITYVGFEAEATRIGEFSPIMFPTLPADGGGTPTPPLRCRDPLRSGASKTRRRQEELFQTAAREVVPGESGAAPRPRAGVTTRCWSPARAHHEFASGPTPTRVCAQGGLPPGWEGDSAVESARRRRALSRSCCGRSRSSSCSTRQLEKLAERALSQEATLDLLPRCRRLSNETGGAPRRAPPSGQSFS